MFENGERQWTICRRRSNLGRMPSRRTKAGVHAYRELRDLAMARGKRFRFESTVLDGIPIFSLFGENLPVIHLNGFAGF